MKVKLKLLNNKPQYNLIRDYFAKEHLKSQETIQLKDLRYKLHNSLNDGLSNEGVFRSTQTTDQGNTPTE